MTIALTNITVKHERRITLIFSEALAAGAFTSTSYYSFAMLNGVGGTPSPLAVIPIPSSPNTCDVVLDTDLAFGGSYTITAIGVPGVSSTATPSGSTLPFSFAVPQNDTNQEVQTIDLDALIFDTDLIWTGADFLEGANGDLAVQSGLANFASAMQRRLTSDTILQWDPSWGLQGGDFVNNPSMRATALKGRLIRQINADDRTAPGSTVTLTNGATDQTAQYYQCTIVPRGSTDATPVVAVIPIP